MRHEKSNLDGRRPLTTLGSFILNSKKLLITKITFLREMYASENIKKERLGWLVLFRGHCQVLGVVIKFSFYC